MPRIIVAGSINMDVVALTERHPRTGETVAGTALNYFPGGKGANQAVAAARLGAETLLVAKIGTDGFAGELTTFLASQGVQLDHVSTQAGPSGTALIIVTTAGENMIVVVPGANATLSRDDVRRVPIKAGDVLVSQFEIPQPTIVEFFRCGKEAGALTILNPAPAGPCDPELLRLSDYLILNETELETLSGHTPLDVRDTLSLVAASKELRTHASQKIVVTLGERGVLAIAAEEWTVQRGHSVKVVDTTGAGDCFIGAFAAQLATGVPFTACTDYANRAAAVSVQRPGAGPSMPTAAEVMMTFKMAN